MDLVLKHRQVLNLDLSLLQQRLLLLLKPTRLLLLLKPTQLQLLLWLQQRP